MISPIDIDIDIDIVVRYKALTNHLHAWHVLLFDPWVQGAYRRSRRPTPITGRGVVVVVVVVVAVFVAVVAVVVVVVVVAVVALRCLGRYLWRGGCRAGGGVLCRTEPGPGGDGVREDGRGGQEDQGAFHRSIDD